MSAATIDFAAIGRRLIHPTQQKILEHMIELDGKVSPNQLSRELDEPLGNVSYHVSVLAGRKKGRLANQPLIKLVDTKPRRGALEHFYALVP
jgi:hypothetical protein